MDLPEKTVDLLASLRELDQAIERSLDEKDRLRERLHLIKMAALNRMDGDSPTDTHWSEIIGLADGDPHWLQHAKANYPVKYAELVQLCRDILTSLPEDFDLERAAHEMADQIEQALLPEMVLSEDGRTFRQLAERAK